MDLFKRALKRALLPLIYGPIYLYVFFYLENRQVDSYHLVSFPLDKYIPFCEYFIIPYYLWFAYIAITVLVFLFLDRKDFIQLIITLGVGMTLFLIVSYVYPNEIQLRPDHFTRSNIFVSLCQAIYNADTSTNVLPSIHCYNSFAAHAAICKSHQLNKYRPIKLVSLLLCLSITASTAFVKQHSLIDIISGFVLFLILYVCVYILPDRYISKNAAA